MEFWLSPTTEAHKTEYEIITITYQRLMISYYYAIIIHVYDIS